MTEPTERTTLLTIAGQIVSAYVANNKIDEQSVPRLLAEVLQQLGDHAGIATGDALSVGTAAAAGKKPAVPVDESVQPDYLICLEDGRKMRSLTRYIGRVYGLTPQAYRQKWNLPIDYPMSAPKSSERRSKIARARFAETGHPRSKQARTAAKPAAKRAASGGAGRRRGRPPKAR